MALALRIARPHGLSRILKQRTLPLFPAPVRQYTNATLFRGKPIPLGPRLVCRPERLRRGFCDGGKAQASAEKESEVLSLLDRVPWGLIFSLSFIGAIGGWFYRGYKNNQLSEGLKAELKSHLALAQEEVEEIRTANNLLLAHYDALVIRIRARYPSRKADPREFFDFCGKALGGDFEANGLKSGHLLERLVLTLDKDENGLVPIEVLLTALSMVVESSVDDRIEALFKAFASLQDKDLAESRQKLSEERLVAFVDSLMKTCQVPVRVLTCELSQYPFNQYDRSTPEYVVGTSINQLVTKRKKDKVLEGYEMELKEEMGSVKALQKDAPPADLSTQPLWNLNDFTDLLKTRSLCAWGECYGSK